MGIKQTYLFALAQGARPKDEETTKVSSVPKGRKTKSGENWQMYVFVICVSYTCNIHQG